MKYVGVSLGLASKFIKSLLETEQMQINNIKQPLDLGLTYIFFEIIKGRKVMITVAPNHMAGCCKVRGSSKDGRILQKQWEGRLNPLRISHVEKEKFPEPERLI